MAVPAGGGLGVADLRPYPPDDVSRPVSVRVQVFEAWMSERDAWVARRMAHEAAHGWPGGTPGRMTEEDEHHPVPDAPFDPDTI